VKLEIGPGINPVLLGIDVVYIDFHAAECTVEPFLVADAQSLPFRSEAFTDIYLCHLFEHLREPTTFLKDAWRVLKHGGRLVMWMPNFMSRSAKRDPLHLHTYSFLTLSRLLGRVGFRYYYPSCNIGGKIPKAVRWMLKGAYLLLSDELNVVAVKAGRANQFRYTLALTLREQRQ